MAAWLLFCLLATPGKSAEEQMVSILHMGNKEDYSAEHT
jgi:hypothetical protein